MDEVVLEAFGKINLYLDALWKREDGYHEIRSIMQSIDLKDTIKIRETNSGMKIDCAHPQVPLDSSNLVYKAWEKMKEISGIDKEVDITIHKRIPVAAGLAGGSADAAAVIKGLNILWDLNLKEEDLMKIGIKIGADVPFCIKGGTCLAEGIGEKLTSIEPFKGKLLLIATPNIPISTEKAYKNLPLDKIHTHPDIDRFIKGIKDKDFKFVAENMINVMEYSELDELKIIPSIKEEMIRFGALGSIMSGSGPTVFGLFEDEKPMMKCKKSLERKIENVFFSRTI
ncbi:MAG: 4-(cytidine 5'-diphospho)-2-C-methyl-D-erythritol kinase [Tissierellaceae bacterium]|nr:4-(cytidine 5'-diphospho)-2-C-methyl-D-erythritol kinase [Tissierellaceae bacterium]